MAAVVALAAFLLAAVALAFPHEASATSGVGQEWVARYNGPASEWDGAGALAVDGSGNVYVTGYSESGGSGHDYATIKYDSEGNEQWVASYDGPGGGYDVARLLTVDGSGNVFVTGESTGSGTWQDYATIKYDSNGNEQWVARYNGTGNYQDRPGGLAVDGSGNVYVTGRSTGSNNLTDYATIKYDSNGNEQWVARYNGPNNNNDGAYHIAVDGLGNVYVTGGSRGSGGEYDYATIKYDGDGNEQWVARYDGPASQIDQASDLAVDGSGNVYITGYSTGSGTDYDYATIKYDGDGSEQWVTRYNGPGNYEDRPGGLAVDGLGNVYITGYSTGSGTDYDYATIKYDGDGNEQWVARYNGPGNYWDFARDLAVDGSGNVYVTGGSTGSGTDYDYATIKYDSGGNQQWLIRYHGGYAEDSASALAVDGSGNVYVTGASRSPVGAGRDSVTIKYGPDSDGDGVPDTTDNCPDTPNPGQENAVHPGTTDGDHCEDPDGDLTPDFSDVCPDDSDNDGDGDGVCNGSGFQPPKTAGNDNCPDTPNPGQENADGDQWGDACEIPECIAVSTVWVTPPGDGDCDGFDGASEVSITTDPADACGYTPLGDPASETWPPDLAESNGINIVDVLQLKPVFGLPSARHDLDASGGNINIVDVLALKPFFGAACTP